MSESRMATAVLPRRRIDRETTPGRCSNLDYCSIGMQRVQIQVAVSEPFLCPECGGRLRPPGRIAGSRRPWVLPTLRVGLLAGCSLMMLGIGYTIGHVQPMVGRALRTASVDTGSSLEAAGTALGITTPPPVAVKAQPAPALPAPAPAPVIVAQDRPFLVHAISAEAAPMPRLQHEARFAMVTIDCALAAGAVHAACTLPEVRGSNAFSEAAVAWLEGLNVQYLPAAGAPADRQQDHRWHVVFQDFAGRPVEPLNP